MLSWIMGSGATTATAGAAQNCPSGSRLITGRIVSAQTGLFKSEKETLEVKMKLVPVPAVRQSDYINSMNVYNTLSQIIPGSNSDVPVWSAYFQANSGARQAANGGYREPGVQANISQPPFTPPGSSSQPQTLHQQPQQPQTQQPRSQQQQYQCHPQHQQPLHQQCQHQQPVTHQFSPPLAPLPPPLPPPPPPPPPSQLTQSQQPAIQQSFVQQSPQQPATPQKIEQSPVTKITGTHSMVEENGPPKKKPRKRNPRPSTASSNGLKKKGGAPAPSTGSTPAATPSDACLPA